MPLTESDKVQIVFGVLGLAASLASGGKFFQSLGVGILCSLLPIVPENFRAGVRAWKKAWKKEWNDPKYTDKK